MVASSLRCAVHVHRSLAPTESHHIWPIFLGGPNRVANRVDVCANGHSSVHEHLDLLIRGDGKVPWRLAIRYGYRVRRLARRGYDQWQASLG